MHIPSWEKACLPNKLGGIGFREGKKWNIALMAKYFWDVSNKQDNLWVRWIDAIYLKGRSIWTVNFQQDASWYFKKLLRLCSIIGDDDVKAAVRRVLTDNYAKNIWNRLILPKHRFIGWQLVNEKLLTRDNISRFIVIPNENCPVCGTERETHSHLFYSCCLTQKIIKEIMSWCGYFSWPNNIRQWLSRPSNNVREHMLNAIVLATLYAVWTNRNSCVFEQECKLAEIASKEVKSTVKLRFLSCNSRRNEPLFDYIVNVMDSW
ncbi:uncharacterized protein LOC115699979 [Cannabis sativa]|uniref:uncharacterized protein LOC115699979 n=1 Tax=Cannabis sativa TaxID=3483 RepID=UPI0029CA5461|nr:uncharacterized protein LOC115699979 [Cannabis sativa]